jgi:hypothetical protein
VRIAQSRPRFLAGTAVSIAGIALLVWFVGGVNGLVVSSTSVWRIEFITRAQALGLGFVFGVLFLVSGIGLCFERHSGAAKHEQPKE